MQRQHKKHEKETKLLVVQPAQKGISGAVQRVGENALREHRMGRKLQENTHLVDEVVHANPERD